MPISPTRANRHLAGSLQCSRVGCNSDSSFDLTRLPASLAPRLVFDPLCGQAVNINGRAASKVDVTGAAGPTSTAPDRLAFSRARTVRTRDALRDRRCSQRGGSLGAVHAGPVLGREVKAHGRQLRPQARAPVSAGPTRWLTPVSTACSQAFARETLLSRGTRLGSPPPCGGCDTQVPRRRGVERCGVPPPRPGGAGRDFPRRAPDGPRRRRARPRPQDL